MQKYVINSECGLARIDAENVEAAKEIYERDSHYDFDGARAGEYPGSWYFISVDHDGEIVEECHLENMP